MTRLTTITSLAAAVLAVLLLWTACAERKEPTIVKSHPEVWTELSSASFHGRKVETVGLISCPGCHGKDYRGGTSGISCYNCHDGPSGHPVGWTESSSENSMGSSVAKRGITSCAPCHGKDYRGGTSGISCYNCHDGPSGHPVGWTDRSSGSHHGAKIELQGPTVCAPCHGEDYRGGISGISCYNCHDGPGGHPVGWTDQSNFYFHGKRAYIIGFHRCRACHGEEYLGGTSGVSCNAAGCHE
ncbi:MAG: hypothetical protein U9N45_00250 [Gemmatimonadota bacterium]|nr:hypothetical protein [Gemmatimonadota bacterium]